MLEDSQSKASVIGSPNGLVPRFLSGTRDSAPFVKICGITNPLDAEIAIESGADALGFNVFADSQRFIDLSRARAWIETLPADIARVLIGVNPSLTQPLPCITHPPFHPVQL